MGMATIRDAVLELAAKHVLPDDAMPTTDMIRRYATAFVERRRMINKLFEQCQLLLRKRPKEVADLLHAYNLQRGCYCASWNERLEWYAGCATHAMFTDCGFKLPTKGYSTFVVIPCYDVPGRICSLLLLGRGNNAVTRIYVEPSDGDDGLAMLGTLQPRNDIVLAVSDTLFALHLQRRHFNVSATRQLPLVVYGANTTYAWQSVQAARVIYWEHDDSYRLFTQALKHPRGYIARTLRYTGQQRFLKDLSLPKIVTHLRDGAVPWAEAMRDFILVSDQTRVADFVLNLDLQATDVQRIYDVCTPSQKLQVQRAFNEVSAQRHIVVGNMKVLELDGSWWIDHGGGERELACDAIVRIEQTVHVVDTGENMYKGVVLYRDKRIAFTAPMEEMEKRADTWLRELMMRHVGAPRLAHAFRGHIVAVAKLFHEPQYVQRVGRVGWNMEVSSFIFPNFSIKDGQIDETVHAETLNAADAPAAALYAPVLGAGEWDVALQSEYEHATIWAGLACFMTNMLAPVVGAAPGPVGFVGPSGSTARVVGKHLQRELNMVACAKARNVSDTVAKENRRNYYPLWLDADEQLNKFYLSADTDMNVMLNVSEGEALALGVGESWTFVHAPAICAQVTTLPSLRGALRFLAWMQAKSFKLPSATSLHASVLDALKMWALDELHAADDTVFAQAAVLLRTVDTCGTDQRLMHLLYWMSANQQFKVDHMPFYAAFTAGNDPGRKQTHVIVDDAAQKIYIHLNAVRSAIQHCYLPTPDYDAAMRAFAASRNTSGFEVGTVGIVVNQTFWDSEARRWQRSR